MQLVNLFVYLKVFICVCEHQFIDTNCSLLEKYEKKQLGLTYLANLIVCFLLLLKELMYYELQISTSVQVVVTEIIPHS